MSDLDLIIFPDSWLDEPKDTQRLAPLQDEEIVPFSIYVKPRPRNVPIGTRTEIFASRTAQYTEDIGIVGKYAEDHGFNVLDQDPRRRRVRLSGSAKQLRQAFGVTLHWYQGPEGQFRSYAGALQIRSDLAAVLESILGLNNRPIAKPRLRRASIHADVTSASYLPSQIARLYSIPENPQGAGQCIAIIELGGGYHESDIQAAFARMQLPPPQVISVSVDGAANAPTTPESADGEVGLDIQVAGAVAPDALLAVYFTENTDAGFADAISQAATDEEYRPSVMSISWGSPESKYSTQARNTLNSVLQDATEAGLIITVAAGDQLSTDGLDNGAVHVDFPSSSPYVVSCGGTSITVEDGRITQEVVWNNGTSGTGGGISRVFPIPKFQDKTELPLNASTGQAGRGLPDVAGNANPYSGYLVTVDGETFPVGGTSAVAPLWAGFFALINSARKTPLRGIHDILYSSQSQKGFREVLHGNNIPEGFSLGYHAGPIWNACCGLGVMNGEQLFRELSTLRAE